MAPLALSGSVGSLSFAAKRLLKREGTNAPNMLLMGAKKLAFKNERSVDSVSMVVTPHTSV